MKRTNSILAPHALLLLSSVAAAGTTLLAACSSDGTNDTDIAEVNGDAGNTADVSDAGNTISFDAPESPDAEIDAAVDAEIPKKVCSDDGWCHTEVPAGQVLRDVWADELGGAFAVTDQGAVLRWDGKAWSTQYSTTAADVHLYSVWGSSATDVWVGGYRSILHGTGTDPNALTWTAFALDTLAPTATSVSVYGTSATDIYAAAGAQVLHFTDAQTGWIVDPVTDLVAGRTTEVWGRVGTADVWISTINTASKKTILYRRGDDGNGNTTWTAANGVSEVPFNVVSRACATPGDPRRGWMSDDSTVWLVGTRSNFVATNLCYYLFHGAEGAGGTYAFDGRVFYDPYFRLNDVWGSGSNDVWLAGDFGVLNHWDGTTWQSDAIALAGIPVKKNLNAIFGRGAADIWVVGDGIALHKGTP